MFLSFATLRQGSKRWRGISKAWSRLGLGKSRATPGHHPAGGARVALTGPLHSEGPGEGLCSRAQSREGNQVKGA